MELCGVSYCVAEGEADKLCAKLVLTKTVYACLSEDMDLFVYGCTRVLRYFSLIGHTAVLYYTKGILEELNMSQTEFREICILSGTDYNIHSNCQNGNVNLALTVKHFRKYKSSFNNNINLTFYNWLLNNTNYISNIELLTKINLMFTLDTNHSNLDVFQNIKIINGPKNQCEIENIMKEDNFIFVKHKNT
jgi:5'-3' exonuclease